MAGLKAPGSIPVWGGGGSSLDIPGGTDMFSTAGHGPPMSPSPAPARRAPTIAYNPIDQSLFVNGHIVKMDDYAGLANSPAALTNPPVPKPTGEWHDVPMESYQGVISEIKDPSLWTVAKRNMEQAMYGMQEIGYGAIGAVSGAMDAGGVQDWASRGAAQANAQQERFSPFNYEFGSGPENSNTKAFVGAVGQSVPWLAGSLASGGAGGVAGLGLRGGLGLAAKQTAKTAFTRGAVGGIAASSYATGVGDVYNESVAAGQPDPSGALIRGVPYALTDAVPELGALAVGLGKISSVSKYVGGMKLPAKIGLGIAAGGIAEGVNEAIQEQILIGEHDKIQPGYADSAEAVHRTLQAGFGGAAPGMLFGGVAGGVSPRINQQQLNNPNITTNLLNAAAVNPVAQPPQPMAAPHMTVPEAFSGGPPGTGPIDFAKAATPPPVQPAPMELTAPNAVPYGSPTGTAPFERQIPAATSGRDFALQETRPSQLTLQPPAANPLLAIQQRQGGNPNQRQAMPAPDTRTGGLPFPPQQMSLLPDPRAVIPSAMQPGRASLMQDRRGDQRPQPQQMVPEGQQALKLPKPKAATKADTLKKGKPVTAPVTQPAVVQTPPAVVAPPQAAAKLKAVPKAPVALKKSPPVASAPAPVLPSSPAKVEPSPPVKEAAPASPSDDALVEDSFSGSMFAQLTYDEALNKKQALQWFNSVQQAITQKPKLEGAIRNYIDSLSPAASKAYDELSHGNAEHDKLTSRGRKVASTVTIKPERGRMVARTESTEAAAKAAVEQGPEDIFHDLIRNKYNLQPKAVFRTKITELYAKVSNKSYVVGGHKLSDYFTNGEPNIIRTRNRNVLVPYEVTDKSREDFAQREKALRTELDAVAQEYEEEDANEARRIANDHIADQISEEMSNEAAADKWNTNSYVNAETGERYASEPSIGRMQLKVAQILSKFKVTPKAIIVSDFNDLPDFIKEDLKKKGGSRDVSGVSFRDQIYIVANKVYGDKHLRAIILHETLGHFGLRSLVDGETLKRLLTDIYNDDAVIRAEADALASSGRYQNREAWELVEEALSERAADLPNNLLLRVWEVIKAALRKVGLWSDDNTEAGPLARALLKASNEYVRNGTNDQLHYNKPSTWANDIMAMANPAGVLSSDRDVVLKNILMGGFNQRRPFIEGRKRAFSKTSLLPDALNGFRGLINSVKSMNDIARQNGGFRKVFEVFQRETRRIHELLNQYNESTKLLHASKFTPPEQIVLGKLLAQTTRAKLHALKDTDIRGEKLLTVLALGEVAIDPTVMAKLKAMGRFSPADFARGIELEYTTDRAVTQADRDASAAELARKLKSIDDIANVRVAAAADPERKKAIIKEAKLERERLTAQADNKFADGVVSVTHVVREAPIVVAPDSQIWKAYIDARDTLDEAQGDMLLAKYTTHKLDAQEALDRAMRRLEDKKRGDPARITKVFAEDIATTFRQIMEANKTIDEESGRIIFDDHQISRAHTMLDRVYSALKDIKYAKDLIEYFPQAHVDKLTDQIKAIHEINKDTSQNRLKANALDFIAGIRTQFTELLGMEEAEMYAKKSIAGGHVALRRYGDYEVNIVLTDAVTKVVVTPSENWENNLMYMRFASQGDAETTVVDLNAELGEMQFDVVNENGESVRVIAHAFASAAETVAPLGHKISLYDFMTVADRLGVHLSAENRERVVKALTKADSKARRSLQRGGNPGEEKDMVRVVAEQLESAAHIVANRENKRDIDRLMADEEKTVWFGDKKYLADLQAQKQSADQSGLADVATKYQKLVDQYQLEYGKADKNALYYKALANTLREWRAAQTSLIAKTENRVVQHARTLTSTMQLGGYVFNIASAAVQMFTLITHVPAYLGTYNAKRAFGGGFGPRAYSEVLAAARDVGHYSLGNLGKLEAKLDSLNLTVNEKRFMKTETKEGVFQAAQFNALQNSKLGTLRLGGQSNRLNAAMQKWMQFFSWSEEANRRITGLAAYRLFYERAMHQGATAEEAHASATAEARQAVYITQGDYSLINRPSWARSGFTSLIFMYKMFPILTVQLVRNLPWSGRAMFAGTMLLLGGFKSLPFAEDLLDIFDGIVQRTGLGTSVTRGNAELALRELLNTFFPGLSTVAARGLLDAMTGYSVSSRIGVGDIVPGTGFMRAGKGVTDALTDLQGPFGGIVSSIYKMSAETLKGNYDRMLREQPITAVKNLVEGYIYLNNGAILNKRGYMVSDDPTTREAIGRFMGFYPERQAQSNEYISVNKISIDFAKEIKGDFVSRYVAAKMDGDSQKAARINSEVQAWNEDAKGTEVEITGFGTAAARAWNAARRPQYKTFEKSAPIAIKRNREHLEALFGIE